MKKAIFGGTFDPIHIGHINIAYEALYRLELDEVIFIPNGNPPHKFNRRVTEEEIRYEMVREAIGKEKRFSISDYEISREEISYTYNTLEYFTKREPETQWYFLVGMDSLMSLYKWRNVDSILKNCILVVLSRSGYTNDEIIITKRKVEKKYGVEIIILSTPMLDISSTDIKNKIFEGKVVNYLILESTEKIINKYNLYRNKV